LENLGEFGMKRKFFLVFMTSILVLSGCSVKDTLMSNIGEEIKIADDATGGHFNEMMDMTDTALSWANDTLKGSGLNLAEIVGVSEDASAEDIINALSSKMDSVSANMDTEDGQVSTITNLVSFLNKLNGNYVISEDALALLPNILGDKEIDKDTLCTAFFGEDATEVYNMDVEGLQDLLDRLNQQKDELNTLKEDSETTEEELQNKLNEIQETLDQIKELVNIKEN